jgi:hypothetical protein
LLDIAVALNFSTQANVTRAFRKGTGMTPGQYRRASARYCRKTQGGGAPKVHIAELQARLDVAQQVGYEGAGTVIMVGSEARSLLANWALNLALFS